MTKRQVTKTITQTTEHRVEFTVEELRKRLRLPENAVLEADGILPEDALGQQLPETVEVRGMQATWTTTTTKGAK